MQQINKLEQETESTAYSQFESEIAKRQVDIANLKEAIATLKAGKPRPVNPSADNAFNLLKEIVGAVPQRLEDEQIYDEKLREADRALQLAVDACEEKVTELKAVRSVEASQQAIASAQELVGQAEKFNAAIDAALVLLAEMKKKNDQIYRLTANQETVMSIAADLNETPYCSIHKTGGQVRVFVRRRFDVRPVG